MLLITGLVVLYKKAPKYTGILSQYGYEIYSTGKVQRSLATQLGISVLEMNQKMCEDSK